MNRYVSQVATTVAVVLFAGIGGLSALGLLTGTWSQTFPQGAAPSPRNQVTSQYDSTNDRLIVSGGNTYGSLQNDVWVLAHATQPGSTPIWTQLMPSGPVPQTREAHASGYDPASNRLVIHGGWPGLADTWVMTNANGLGGSPQWLALPSAPFDRTAPAYAYDTTTNRLIVFGGMNVNYYTTEGWYRDVWVLADANGLGSPSWQQLTPLGPPPPARYYPATAYDPISNRLIVHGGVGDDGQLLGDMWVLTNANGIGGVPEWIELPVAGGPPPTVGHHFGYDPESKKGIIVAGEVRGVEWYTNEVWQVDNADGTAGAPIWRQVTMSGPDFGGNQVAAFGYAPESQRFVLALGVIGSGYRNDVWLLQLEEDDDDTTAPDIVISSPVNQTYLLGQSVLTSYTCTDGGSGVAACAGTVADGANIPTSAVGAQTFVVNASDLAGNASSESIGYVVSYGSRPIHDPEKPFKGNTANLRVQLQNADGTNVSSGSVALTALTVYRISTETSGPAEDTGNANPDKNFNFDPYSGNYVYHLNIKGLATGTYLLMFSAGSDPTIHSIQFQVG